MRRFNRFEQFQSYDIYVNGTRLRRCYSLTKAINLAQKWCGELFETRKTEVIDSYTGEILYHIN